MAGFSSAAVFGLGAVCSAVVAGVLLLLLGGDPAGDRVAVTPADGSEGRDTLILLKRIEGRLGGLELRLARLDAPNSEAPAAASPVDALDREVEPGAAGFVDRMARLEAAVVALREAVAKSGPERRAFTPEVIQNAGPPNWVALSEIAVRLGDDNKEVERAAVQELLFLTGDDLSRRFGRPNEVNESGNGLYVCYDSYGTLVGGRAITVEFFLTAGGFVRNASGSVDG